MRNLYSNCHAFLGKRVSTVDLPLRNSVSLSHFIAHTVILNDRNLYYRPGGGEGGYKKGPLFRYLKLKGLAQAKSSKNR